MAYEAMNLQNFPDSAAGRCSGWIPGWEVRCVIHPGAVLKFPIRTDLSRKKNPNLINIVE